MPKVIVTLILLIHGIIHSMGFIKAFGFATIPQLSSEISKSAGLFWLLTTILFLIACILYIFDNEAWYIIAIAGITISQILIFIYWTDAAFGTLPNIIICILIIFSNANFRFYNNYKNLVNENLEESTYVTDSILTENDIIVLPEPVRKYLLYSGVVGKPKLRNFKVSFTGQIRKDNGSEWMQFSSEQFNFIQNAKRFFFMKAIMKHLPVNGFHCFQNGIASMDIRLLSIFKVQYQSGHELNQAETVTFFNDMCCMAPASVIDNRIKWLNWDTKSANATFTCNNITISAVLSFDDEGKLINFSSNDRFALSKAGHFVKTPWSTPISSYQMLHGYKLPETASTIYHYPDGDLCYGEFHLTDVEYNSELIK